MKTQRPLKNISQTHSSRKLPETTYKWLLIVVELSGFQEK